MHAPDSGLVDVQARTAVSANEQTKARLVGAPI
jgi:hypothetical protein